MTSRNTHRLVPYLLGTSEHQFTKVRPIHPKGQFSAVLIMVFGEYLVEIQKKIFYVSDHYNLDLKTATRFRFKINKQKVK